MKLAQEPLTLTQSTDAVDKLCGGVAHELNNLLSVILGEADLALMFGAVNPEQRQSFVAIRRAGGQAAALTRQLLSFSQRQLVQPTVFNLSDVLREEDMDPTRSFATNIERITCSSAINAWVLADKSQIEQVVHSLVENAREAMPEGGRLTLHTSNVTLDEKDSKSRGGIGPGEYVLLTVTDTGAGMTDEVKAHIFEPFFTTKSLGQGAGLGLATCLAIVKQSGGHVRIDSEVGVGTVCEVHLPQAPARTQGSAMDGAELPTGTEVILLTENDHAVREVATRILQGLGYRVLQAANASDALRILTANETTVDLLLTDVVLPHIGGRELAERARQVRPGVRVLFTSGYTNDVILQRQLAAHDVTFVQKPFTPASLGRKVREVLDAPARSPA